METEALERGSLDLELELGGTRFLMKRGLVGIRLCRMLYHRLWVGGQMPGKWQYDRNRSSSPLRTHVFSVKSDRPFL